MSRVDKLYTLYEKVTQEGVNFYEALGVTQDVEEGQLKKAYRKLSIICHPDNYVNEVEEIQTVAANCSYYVNLMYETLLDPVKRSHYDLTGTILDAKDYEQAQSMKRNQERIDEIFEPIKDFIHEESYAVTITVPLKLVYHGGVHTFKYDNQDFSIKIPKGMQNPTMFVLKGVLGDDSVTTKGNLAVLAMQGTSKDCKLEGTTVKLSAPKESLKFDEEEMLKEVKILGHWIDVSDAVISKNKSGTKFKVEGYGIQNDYLEEDGDLIIEVVSSKAKAKPKKKNVE